MATETDFESPTREGRSLRANAIGGRYEFTAMLRDAAGVRSHSARDVRTGTRVVVRLRDASSVTRSARMRMEHHARALMAASATRDAAPVEFGDHEGAFYVTRRWQPGEPLTTRLARGPLDIREATAIAAEIAEQLAAAFAAGVTHGAIAPSNVIVDGVTVFLVDFACARPLTTMEVGPGLAYFAPEQIGSVDAPIDERADHYAVGALLYHMIAGRAPFGEQSLHALIREQLAERPARLRATRPEVPRALDELVQRLLAKDPRERYQTARALADDLQLVRQALESSLPGDDIVLGGTDQRETLADAAFVPRPREMRILHDSLGLALEGKGGIVRLEAESGGGKTRLLDEFAQEARAKGFRTFHGQGVDHSAQLPFHIMTGVLEGTSRALMAQTQHQAAFSAALGDELDALLHLAPSIRRALGASRPTELGPEAHGERRSIHALSRFLDALTAECSPALVILDDAQWADDATLKLLKLWSEVTSRPHHIVVVTAFRTEEVPRDHALRAPRALADIVLDSMTRESVAHLVVSMAGSVPDEAIDLAYTLGAGSPFMATAVLRGLVESGALAPTSNGWAIDSALMTDMRASDHSGAFLARRLRLLSDDALAVLCVGAILGKEFQIDAVSALSGRAGPATIDALEIARKRHILWRRPEEGRYAFVHDKLREALFDMLTRDERARLHRKAAQEFEREVGERTFDIAYHYDAANDAKRALPYALDAAERARQRHALALAEENYQIALRGVDPDDRITRKRIEEGLGDVLMLRGRYDEAAACLETARDLASTSIDRAQVLAKSGELAFKRGDVRMASEALEEGLRALGRPAPRTAFGYLVRTIAEASVQLLHTFFPRHFVARRSREGTEVEFVEIRLLSRLAYAYWFHKGLVACGWAHLRELNLAERYPESEELAQAYSEHAPVMTMIPYAARGLAYAERSRLIRERQGNIWGQGQSLHFHAVVLYASSRYEECIDTSRRAIRLLGRTGDMWEVNTAKWHIAFSQQRLGLHEQAIETAKEVYESAKDLGDSQAMGIALGVWARASEGNAPDHLVEEAVARGTEDAHTATEVAMASALMSLRMGDPHRAVATLESAARLIRRRGLRQEYVAPIQAWLATALAALAAETLTLTERRAAVRRGLRAARRALSIAVSYQNNLPHALRERGRFHALMGNKKRARILLDRSIQIARDHHAAHEEQLSLRLLDELAPHMGWPPLETGTAASRDDIPAVGGATLSLQDRYQTLLEAGRRITTQLDEANVHQATREAALALLRAPTCAVLPIPSGPETGLPPRPAALYETAIAEGDLAAFRADRPRSSDDVLLASGARSAMLVVIRARGEPRAVLYAEHDSLTGAFREEEASIGRYLAALAGGALENASGFAKLRQVNEALHVQKALLERQGEVSIDGILVVSTGGKILSANKRFAEMWGLTPEDLVDDSRALAAVGNLLAEPEEFYQRVRELYANPSLESRDEVRLSDGRILDRYSAPLLAEDGGARARVWFFRDITEERMAAKKLQDVNARLEQVGQLKTLLLNTASHELNTPLTPMKLQIFMLESGKLGPLGPAQEKAVKVVSRNIGRLGHLVQDLMDVSRIQGGRLNLVKRPANLRAILDEAQLSFEHAAKDGQIEVIVEAPAEIDAVFDAKRLSQVVFNLLSNALKFTPPGGTVFLRASQSHAQIRLNVRDSGAGMTREQIARLFQPFSQVHDPMQHTKPGTGLGLYICKGIIDEHGGRIWCESEGSGQGSEFIVEIPAG